MSSNSKLDAIGRNQSAYMLETASDYLRAAKVIWLQPNLQSVAMVNAAIAIEIILKSFISQPTNNMRKGTVGEQYEIKQKVHLFNEIAARIDRDIYDKLNFSRYCSFLKRIRLYLLKVVILMSHHLEVVLMMRQYMLVLRYSMPP